MSTLAEFMIVAGADNRPPMLDKSMYESWKSRMELYIQGKDHERIILNSFKNSPLIWPTVEQENGTVRPKIYEKLSDKLQADSDLKATNIVLQGLPPDVYSLVNHHRVSKEIWERVKLLMQGASLSKQERLAIPTFLPGDDPIACINKAIAFLSALFSLRYPSTNNQLRSSSNPRTKPLFKKVESLFSKFKEDKPKRRRDVAWFKEKVLLVQAQAKGKELDEEQLAFLADPEVADGQVAQTITHNAAFQTNDLDVYDFDYDDISSNKAVLMANLSSCDSDVLSEDKANNESKIVNESLTTELERYKERVKILEQRFNVDLSSHEKFIDSQMDDMMQMKNTKFAAFETKIDTLKQTLSKYVKEKESLLTTLNGFKTDFKQRESKSINKEIVLENKNKELENTVYFGKRFVSQQELPAKQMFRLQSSNKNSEVPSTSNTPVKIEVPSELPKKMNDDSVDICNKCLELAAEFVKKNDVYIELSKWFSNLEHHCISLEVAMQLNQEIFRKDKSVICSTGASGSKPTGNTKNNRISQSSSSNKTNKVEDQSRSVKSRTNKKNCVSKTECNADVIHSMLNANSESVCAICNECLFDSNHDKCVLDYVHDVNVLSKSKPVKCKNTKQIWKPTVKVYTDIAYKWKVIGRTFTIVENKCPLTRFTSTKVVPLKETTIKLVLTPTPGIKVYSRRSKAKKSVGYGDYQIGNVTISSVYYVEGLGHNLFSISQFCDSDLEVAFCKNTCFVHNFKGVYLLMGSRRTNLYTLSMGDMMKSSPICLLSKASKTKKSKKHSQKPKSEDTNQEKLYLLHMDLCGPMRVKIINGKKYMLVIVDDYSWGTWVKFLKSKDEAPEFIIKFLKMIQARLNATIRNIRTDNGIEFVNQTLRIYYEDVAKAKADVGIFIGYAPAKKACRIYNRCTTQIMEIIHVDFDELTAMAYEQSSSGPALQEMTPKTLSLRLVPNPSSPTPFVIPTRNDRDTLFQPLFDEYFNLPPSVDHPVPEVAAPELDVSTGTPSLTSID
ncbi:retrovirus-related pol polyprotein from transposon TNT 1-94 [Tanacetum coccineum]|uniref:Retrovirus-related pol polyprotein from transposon TNT 1-94 n=1 Tax=Tanacetum coccineum TaxID=301880 RepID=A0ABQ5F5V8_9ASTR